MGWITDDGDHEGWAAAEFPDGRVSTGASSAAGVLIRTPEDAISMASIASAETADGRTAIGWRGMCTCGWRGPLWRRVPTEDAAALARRLVYWAEPDIWAEPPGALPEAIRDEWNAHLPSPALVGVKAAAAAARQADGDLDEAVRRARLDGATWAAIGDAAGMTRQSANERWKRLQDLGEMLRIPAALEDLDGG